MSAQLTQDHFLSKILGRRSFRLALEGETPLDQRAAKELHTVLDTPKVFCFTRIPVTDVQRAGELRKLGFDLVDTTLTFEKPLTTETLASSSDSIVVTDASPIDREGTAALAGRVFQYSRFHLDPKLPKELANRVKAEWASNFFTGGRGDRMVVAKDGSSVVGFLQLLRDRDTLVIDLIGVDAKYQGRGIAARMIHYGETQNPDLQTVRVGTQTSNTTSARFYEKLGFRLSSASYVFHYHGGE